MCELFALSSNKPVSISFTWRGFRKRGRIHRDGWGIAWYLDDGTVGLVKEPRPSTESPIARLMVRGVRSRIVVSHVRWASRGEVSYVNTHPFVRRLWDRDWVFAHNGTLEGFVEDPRYRLEECRPVGSTDSEHAFCYIIQELSRSTGMGLEGLASKLWSLIDDIARHGMFNILLSDGEHLFSYTNVYGRLHYLLRHPPHKGTVMLLDDDYMIDLEEMKAPDEYATLIATIPLTDEEWHPMKPGTLYLFQNGDLLLTVTSGEPRLALDRLEQGILRVIRSSPRSVKLRDIAERAGLGMSEARMAVTRLLNKKLVRQHPRDRVPSGHPEARYYTNPGLRSLIDRSL